MKIFSRLTMGSGAALRVYLVILGLLTSTMPTPSACGQSELSAAAKSDGLKGLLPAEPPSHLLEIVGGLPESWQKWTDRLSSELNSLYRETPDDVAAQRETLARLKARIRTIDRALTDRRYDPIRNGLVETRGMLIKHVDLLEAVLDTLSTHDAANYAKATKQDLVTSLNSLDSYLDQVAGGQSWKIYLRTDEVRRGLESGREKEEALQAKKRSLRNLQRARGSNDSAVREFCERPVLRKYLIDLDRGVAASEHETSGIQWGKIRDEFKTLLAGLQEYEENKLLSAAGRARSSYDRLRQLSPNGGDRLTRALRLHYLNSNFQASISDGFLNSVMGMTRVEAGEVRDFILGTDVYGNQTTSSRSTIRFLPADSAARLQIQLNGDVATDTQAYASRAVIYSNGNQHFDGFKDVFFDGLTFSTSSALLNVTASNQPVGASTRADGIPILAGIGRRIAMRTANRNRPETEAIAAQRVDSRVLPRFNEEVDSAFARLNVELRDKVAEPLKSEQLYPDYISARSTDSELNLRTRLMPEGKLGGGAAPVVSVGPEDIVFSFHESLLNNALDPLQIAGQTLTEVELEDIITRKLRTFFPKLKRLQEGTPSDKTEPGEPKRIVFAKNDPLRVGFENGNVLLVIRAGFERDEERGVPILPQLITIPLTISLAINEIVLTRGDISIEPLAANDDITQQVLLSGVIKSRLEKSIPETSKSASTFNIDSGDKSLRLRVSEITVENGWISARARSELLAQPF